MENLGIARRESKDDSIKFLSEVADCEERSGEFNIDSDNRCESVLIHEKSLFWISESASDRLLITYFRNSPLGTDILDCLGRLK